MNIESVLKNHGIGGKITKVSVYSLLPEECDGKDIFSEKLSKLIYDDLNSVFYGVSADDKNIVKFDKQGNETWRVAVIPEYDTTISTDIKLDSSGNIYTCKHIYENSLYTSKITKISPSGSEVWTITYPFAAMIRCIDVWDEIYALSHTGNLIKFDLNGDEVTRYQYGSNDFRHVTGARYGGGYIFAFLNGDKTLKRFSKGTLSFSKSTTPFSTYAYAITTDSSGNIFMSIGLSQIIKIEPANLTEIFNKNSLSDLGYVRSFCLDETHNVVCVSLYDYNGDGSHSISQHGLTFLDIASGSTLQHFEFPNDYAPESGCCVDDKGCVYVGMDTLGKVMSFERIRRIS